MDIIEIIGRVFGVLMNACYQLVNNHVLAILLFTALTKIILLPISMWTQKNGIIMVKLMPEINQLKLKHFGDKDAITEETQKLYKREKYQPLASTIPLIIQIIMLMGVMSAIRNLVGNSNNILTAIPTKTGGLIWLMPLCAGLSSLILAFAQCKLGPLQREQEKMEQISTGAFSVCLSLFLGINVSLGTGIYWIASNLLAIPIQLLLNVLVNPKKYVDYEALEKSRKELESVAKLGNTISKEDKKKEREDYKRFFSVVNKHLVFYSEKSGFYKYFKDIIEYLLAHSNITIHYVTNDPKDQIFAIAEKEPRIRAYYIGPQKIITLMMKMDADMVIMTTPDLDNFHIKRSYIRKDIEYVYICHSMMSAHMGARKGAFDHFDTILCAGQHQMDEIREGEQIYDLPAKNLVPLGYGMLDNMLKAYENMPKDAHDKKYILIAPSWQKDNILDSCIDELIEQLYNDNNYIVVRPHPEYVKRFPAKLEALLNRFKDADPNKLVFETDFSSNVTIYTADIVISDWSGIAQEFAFTTKKPALLINTPMKILNPDYVRYKNIPIDIMMRDNIGRTLDLDKIDTAAEAVAEIFENQESYSDRIIAFMNKYIFNIGNSAAVGGKYILKTLQNKRKSK